jgi:acetyl-CoA carboxylase carboxyl transferase subunit alpha
MGITAQRLFSLKLVDNIIQEPLGGAHRDYDQIAGSLKQSLIESLDALESITIDRLLDQRYQKLMAFGQYREA